MGRSRARCRRDKKRGVRHAQALQKIIVAHSPEFADL
ncbi:hypothetical protein CLAFUW4_03946, partial [Fulvia fulva]